MPRWLRVISAVLLIFGGLLGFLPVLGFWMLPLGVVILSYDFAWARRLRRRFEVYFVRGWRARLRRGRTQGEMGMRTRNGDE